jgi:hypothetical protein
VARDHHDGDEPRGFLRLELGEHGVAVHDGHIEIEQDQIGRGEAHVGDHLTSIRSLNHLIATLCEHVLRDGSLERIIIGDEDSIGQSLTSCSCPLGAAGGRARPSATPPSRLRAKPQGIRYNTVCAS